MFWAAARKTAKAHFNLGNRPHGKSNGSGTVISPVYGDTAGHTRAQNHRDKQKSQ